MESIKSKMVVWYYLSVWRGQVSGGQNGSASGRGRRGATLIQVREIFSGGALGWALQATVCGSGARNGWTGAVWGPEGGGGRTLLNKRYPTLEIRNKHTVLKLHIVFYQFNMIIYADCDCPLTEGNINIQWRCKEKDQGELEHFRKTIQNMTSTAENIKYNVHSLKMPFASPEMLLLLRVFGRTGSIWAEALRTEWRDGLGERFCFFHLDDSLIPPARIFNWRTNGTALSLCVQHCRTECIFSPWDSHSS